MRTKNGKRIGPVPIALVAVFALAAFLSAGLLLANGAQPAAAQDADCTFELDSDGAIPTDDITCDAMGDTAVVEFKGHAEHEEDVTLSILIADKSGPITAYPQGTEWDTVDGRLEDDSAAASAAKYRYMSIEIPKAASNPTTGIVEGQSVTIMVKGDARVWLSSVSVTDDITNIPDTEDIDGARAVAADGTAIDITLLGMPVVGKDGDDFNPTIDDDIVDQCIVQGDARERIVAEVAGCSNPDTAAGAAIWQALDPNPDMMETRSKLLARTGEVDAIATSATILIDGKMMTHTLSGPEDTVTIYAVLKDEDGNDLHGTEVSFTTTTMPAGIVAARDLSDDVDAEEVVTEDAGNDEIILTGLDSATADLPNEGIIVTGDAVATYTLDSLPDGANDSYRIEVVVTAGDVTLGTMVIARMGPADKVVAGVFNAACFPEPKGNDADDDLLNNTFDEDAKYCDASGMARRFGHGETFVVKAHHEDVRDLVVGDGGDLSVEFMNEDDDLLDGGDPEDLDDPVMPGDPAQAWVYTVHEDATLGDHMITVSTDETDADDEAIDDVTLTVTVAGPPTNLVIGGDATIPLNGSQTYTVTATDMLDGIPHLTPDGDDQNDMVTVSVQPTDALVVGVNTAGQVMLGDDGTAEFTVYASLDADDGDAGRIIARSGDLQHILTITFGMTDTTPGDELMAPTGIDVSSLLNTINVVWTPNSAQNATLIKVVLFDEDVTEIVAIKSYNPASSDPGAHDFENVAPGSYNVVVAAFRSGEPHVLSDRHPITIR